MPPVAVVPAVEPGSVLACPPGRLIRSSNGVIWFSMSASIFLAPGAKQRAAAAPSHSYANFAVLAVAIACRNSSDKPSSSWCQRFRHAANTSHAQPTQSALA